MGKRTAPKNRTDDGKTEISRNIWEAWRHARVQIKAWEERAKLLRDRLEAEIADNDYATINGVPVISWVPSAKRHKFNQDAFKKDHPDLFAQYWELTDGTRPFTEVDFDPEDLYGPDEDYPEEDES